MTRLPIAGSDEGTWGDLLNTYLQVTHNPDGSMKNGVIAEANLDSAAQTKLNSTGGTPPNGSVTEAMLDTAAQAKLNSGGVTSINTRTGAITLVKTDVGLGSVDNTSDANKPISTATATALTGKVDKSTLTTKGDLLGASASATPIRVAAGTDGQVLTSSSAQASGLTWSTVSGVPLGTAAQPGTSVLVGTSSSQIVAANASRQELYIYNNHASNVLYLSLGGTAGVGQGARVNPNGDYFYTTSYTGAISAIATGANTNVSIAEV